MSFKTKHQIIHYKQPHVIQYFKSIHFKTKMCHCLINTALQAFAFKMQNVSLSASQFFLQAFFHSFYFINQEVSELVPTLFHNGAHRFSRSGSVELFVKLNYTPHYILYKEHIVVKIKKKKKKTQAINT